MSISLSLNSSLPSTIRDVRVFGSQARHDSDSQSDIDIVAITTDTSDGAVSIVKNSLLIPSNASCDILILPEDSFYEIFAEGTPFAWHLFLESKSLLNPRQRFFDLPKPNAYTLFDDDLKSFIALMRSVVAELEADTRQATYEAGVASICLRNVGIALSLALARTPVFDRWALEKVCISLNISCPLTHQEIDLLAGARKESIGSSLRHGTPPTSEFLRICQNGLQWMESFQNLLLVTKGPRKCLAS